MSAPSDKKKQRNSRGCCIECGEINVGEFKWCKWCGSAKGFRDVEIDDVEKVFVKQREKIKSNVNENRLSNEEINKLNRDIGSSREEYTGARTKPSKKIQKTDRRSRPGELSKLNDERKRIREVVNELDEILDD